MSKQATMIAALAAMGMIPLPQAEREIEILQDQESINKAKEKAEQKRIRKAHKNVRR